MKVIERIKMPNGKTRIFVHEDMKTVNEDGEIVPSVSLTDQSFKDDCDVNVIVDRFNKTGHLTHLAKHQGVYADLSEVTDLLDMSIKIQNAQDAFMALPAELRAKMGNDPINLPEYLNDPENAEELTALGILNPKKDSAGSTLLSSKNEKNEDSKTTTKKQAPTEPKQQRSNDDDKGS